MLHQNQIILIVKSDFGRNIFSVYWRMSSGFCRPVYMLRSTVRTTVYSAAACVARGRQGREPAIFLLQKYKIVLESPFKTLRKINNDASSGNRKEKPRRNKKKGIRAKTKS
jgi:hypothetical protein